LAGLDRLEEGIDLRIRHRAAVLVLALSVVASLAVWRFQTPAGNDGRTADIWPNPISNDGVIGNDFWGPLLADLQTSGGAHDS
jgi:hypothetical protein